MLNIAKNESIYFYSAHFNLQPSAWHKKFDLKSKRCYYGAWERRFCTRYLLITPSNLLCGKYFPPSFHGVECISRRRDRLKKLLVSSNGGYSCETVSVYEIQFTIVICSCDQTVRIGIWMKESTKYCTHIFFLLPTTRACLHCRKGDTDDEATDESDSDDSHEDDSDAEAVLPLVPPLPPLPPPPPASSRWRTSYWLTPLARTCRSKHITTNIVKKKFPKQFK